MRNRGLFLAGIALTITLSVPTHAQTAQEITLYTFTGGSDGYYQLAGVVFDSTGNLYGTNYFGGTLNDSCRIGCGTVFQLTPSGTGQWTFNTLHSFAGSPHDVGHSQAHVTFDSKGDLYGTAGYGGGGYGGVFKLSALSSWAESAAFNFTAGSGDTPAAGLTLYQGSLYGSTQFGPETNANVGNGTVFKLAPKGSRQWKHNLLHVFHAGNDGYEPQADLVFDQHGHAYGSTPYGGANQSGDIFELKIDFQGKWKEDRIYTFPFFALGVSFYPSTLIVDSAGNLYGTTGAGGTGCAPYGCGTVFELQKTAAGWQVTTLYEFLGGMDGTSPGAGLVFDAQGNLYGTTFLGGTGTCDYPQYTGCGTVFKLTPTNGTWQKVTVYNFTGGADGEFPSNGSLVLDASGNLYGTTIGGEGLDTSTTGFGTVYKLQP